MSQKHCLLSNFQDVWVCDAEPSPGEGSLILTVLLETLADLSIKKHDHWGRSTHNNPSKANSCHNKGCFQSVVVRISCYLLMATFVKWEPQEAMFLFFDHDFFVPEESLEGSSPSWVIPQRKNLKSREGWDHMVTHHTSGRACDQDCRLQVPVQFYSKYMFSASSSLTPKCRWLCPNPWLDFLLSCHPWRWLTSFGPNKCGFLLDHLNFLSLLVSFSMSPPHPPQLWQEK